MHGREAILVVVVVAVLLFLFLFLFLLLFLVLVVLTSLRGVVVTGACGEEEFREVDFGAESGRLVRVGDGGRSCGGRGEDKLMISLASFATFRIASTLRVEEEERVEEVGEA